MGYRSNIAFAITKEKYLEHKILLQDGLSILDLAKDRYSDRYAHYFYWEEIKWYGNYRDVEGLESLMDTLDTTEDDEDFYPYYAFVRIGEDLDDMEQRGNINSFELEIERTISFPTLQPFTG